MVSARAFLGGAVTLHAGESLDVLRGFSDCSIDSVVTDPPYALNFMAKKWDSGETAFSVEFWGQVLRVLKPGAHIVAFGGTRSYHRLACAIEDAGFEIRDQIGWAYGQGFPKSLDVSKAIDKMAGAERKKVAVGAPVKRMIPGVLSELGHWLMGIWTALYFVAESC
jgi:DNA modification methylase